MAVRLVRLVLLLLVAGIYVWLAAGRPATGRLRALAASLLVLAAASYPNFGLGHPQRGTPPAPAHIHYWDTFHYFMGAKYLPELAYGGLYEATLTAGRELGAFDYVTHLRDLATYGLRAAGGVNAAAVRGRFTPERWEAFKRDLLFFGPRINEWRGLLQDHGYNDPPPRAWLLHAVVRDLPATPRTVTLVTSIDYVLVLLAFTAAWWGFGGLAAMLAFATLWLSPLARFDFIGGALLRWDWLAALVMGASALARGWGATAGALLGYAVLARVFPALLLLPLLARWLRGRRAGEIGGPAGRCLATALLVLVLAGALLAALGEGSLAPEYRTKLRLHGEGAFINSVGLGAMIAAYSAPWSLGADGRVFVAHAALIAARPPGWVLALAVVVYAALAWPLALRARPAESLVYGVPLLFLGLSLSGYYYSFLILLMLLPWHAGRAEPLALVAMGLLAALFAAAYAVEAVSPEMLTFFAAVSLQLALYFVLWLGLEYVRARARAARPAADVSAHDTVGPETRLPRL
ncbi:MAG TPA: hypothetical protein VJU81_18095 [Methylomirabilota bacterium]|nr:hypothetical protein [Methylomirabilota bacterium]